MGYVDCSVVYTATRDNSTAQQSLKTHLRRSGYSLQYQASLALVRPVGFVGSHSILTSK